MDYKLPPHSIEAEQSILGALLLDNTALDKIVSMLSSEDFYAHQHRLVWDAITSLIGASKEADVVTVANLLADKLDDAGGLSFLGGLVQNTPSAANIRHHAKIVRDHSLRRKTIGLLQDATEVCYHSSNETGEIVDALQGDLMRATENRSREWMPISEARRRALARLDRIHESRGILGLPTGFLDLDAKTGGLEPGDLIIIGARPSMGKTSLMMQVSEHIASKGGTVGVFSLEMTDEQLGMREISAHSQVPMHLMRNGGLTDEHWERLSRARAESPLYLDTTPAASIAHIRARARALKQRHGLALIVVDYLTLMDSRDGESRDERVGNLAKGLKMIAKDLNVPVLALAQLNRDLERRPDKRPIMADLRESGSIEAAADVILFLYRDEVYHEDTNMTGIAEVIIAKQRNGPLGKVFLTWRGEVMRFENFIGEIPRHEPRRMARGFVVGVDD